MDEKTVYKRDGNSVARRAFLKAERLVFSSAAE
jgi:hypothetical protein